MIPEHDFAVICCPRCRGDFAAQERPEQLVCAGCGSVYPVVEGIPLLREGSEDEVSELVAEFYDSAWKRDAENTLRGKKIHEDLSTLGQAYYDQSEDRFVPFLQARDARREFFLDAACGAQPRAKFGENYRYHICVDFSLDGLAESRKVLGDRAICVQGSLLKLPLKDRVCDGIMASHCLYHIDQDLQEVAIEELLRVLASPGRMLIFYGNPDRVSHRLLTHRVLGRINRITRRIQPPRPPAPDTGTPASPVPPPLYCHLHSIGWMRDHLSEGHPDATVAVKRLRHLTDSEGPEVFGQGVFGPLWFRVHSYLDRAFEDSPESAHFISYLVTRP